MCVQHIPFEDVYSLYVFALLFILFSMSKLASYHQKSLNFNFFNLDGVLNMVFTVGAKRACQNIYGQEHRLSYVRWFLEFADKL